MSTRSEAWQPAGGWDRFSKSDAVEELVWELLATWDFLNPTVTQSVWESPEGATVFLAFDANHELVELVVGHAGEEDEDELVALLAQIQRRFGMVNAASSGAAG